MLPFRHVRSVCENVQANLLGIYCASQKVKSIPKAWHASPGFSSELVLAPVLALLLFLLFLVDASLMAVSCGLEAWCFRDNLDWR